MKFAAVVLALLCTSSLRAAAQSILSTDTENSTRVIAASTPLSTTSGRSTPIVQPLPPSPIPAANALTGNESSADPVITVTLIKVKPEPQHRFIDRTNSLAFAALAGSLTADALSTQKGLAFPRFHEMNPLARPFVQSRTGAAFYTAGSFAFLGGGMYLAHKTNHHKFEKITPFIVSGWEAFLAARNYHLISKATSQH